MVYQPKVHSSEASVLPFDVQDISGQGSLKQLKLRQMQVRKGGLPPLELHNSKLPETAQPNVRYASV